MFRLHERTRRQWCVAAFVGTCLVPTLAVLAWCAAWNWPGREAAEARGLSRRLGLAVTLSRADYPRPGIIRYRDLALADPETGARLLSCDAIEATWATAPSSEGPLRRVLLLRSPRVLIAAGALDRLRQVPARLLTGEPGTADGDVRLAVAELAIDVAQRQYKLTEVQAAVESLGSGAQAQATFRIAGVEMSAPARLRLVRNRQVSPPSNGVDFDSGGARVPCELLALGREEFGALGGRAGFRGYCWANAAADGCRGELTGQLCDVDLGGLVGAHFPHRLTGLAQIEVQSAKFHNGRLEEAFFAVSAGPGQISRTLFEAAAERLKLVRTAAPPSDGDLIAYEQLALAAALDPHGLRLRGRFQNAPGTILVDRQNCLLGEPALQPQPIAALLQTLAPESEWQVPATRETDWLAQRLPAPPPTAGEPAQNATRLRLRQSMQ